MRRLRSGGGVSAALVLHLLFVSGGVLALPSGADAQGAAAPARPVTYSEDVAPILLENCASCHRPGEVAPFNLLTYDDARQRARQIAESVEHRFMPPWKPKPGIGEFDNERRLTEAEIATLRQWVADGTLEGDPQQLPAIPAFTPGWQLGKPDLIVTMPDGYDLQAEGGDVFRNFVLPVPIKRSQWVSAIEFRPGNAKVVHHARILIDDSHEVRRRDSLDPLPGFGGMDVPGARFPEGHFLGWAPGKIPTRQAFPWALEPGTDLVVQIHMKPTGKTERVRASIGLYFTNKPPAANPVMLRLGSKTIDIPAGAKAHVVTDSYTIPVDADARRIYPHAHYLAREMTVYVRMPDGSVEGLLHIPDWDFNWQDDYEYRQPVALPRGSTLVMRYVYDNSAENPRNPQQPPARVRFGPEGTDEMGELLVQLVPRYPGELAALRTDVARKTIDEDVAGEEKRVADHPDDFETRNALGVHYMQLGRVDEAVRELERVLTMAPDHAVSQYNLGVIAVSRNDPAQAIARFERAVASRPDFADAHNNMAVVLDRQGRSDEALAHFRKAVAVNPDHFSAYNNMGVSLLRRGFTDKGIDALREAQRLRPSDPVVLDRLAVAYASIERYDMAARYAKDAFERALATGSTVLARDIRARLEEYQLQSR